MANSSINPVGLHKRPTFNELVDTIQNDPFKIKYPDRLAKMLRNSFELSQLDGAGMDELEQQRLNQMKEQKQGLRFTPSRQ